MTWRHGAAPSLRHGSIRLAAVHAPQNKNKQASGCWVGEIKIGRVTKDPRDVCRETGWEREWEGGWEWGGRECWRRRCPSGPSRVKVGLQVCDALISPAVSHLWAWAGPACDPDQWTALRIMRQGTPTGIMHSHDDHSIMHPVGQAVGRSVGATEDAGFCAFDFFSFFNFQKHKWDFTPRRVDVLGIVYYYVKLKNKILIDISNLFRNYKSVCHFMLV